MFSGETHNIEIVFMYTNYNVRVSMELLYRLTVYERTEQILYCMNKNQSTPNVTASSESIFWHRFLGRTTLVARLSKLSNVLCLS